MAVSTVGVADAASPDKYLHTWSRTISATAREDQFVLPGEMVYPTYNAIANNISIATTDSHILQVMGDGTNYSRVKRIEIAPNTATGFGLLRVFLYRLSTAGTGGGAVVPSPYDAADTYAGGAMTLPSSKGTEGAILHAWNVGINAGTPTMMPQTVIWEEHPGTKPIIFGTAVTNGIAFKVMAGVTGGTAYINVEFTTSTFL